MEEGKTTQNGDSKAENKKVWLKPEVEVINKDSIKAGSSIFVPEGGYAGPGVLGSAS